MKWIIALLGIATLAAAVWTWMYWKACGFFIFDNYYLNFKDEALNHPEFFQDFDATCRRILLEAIVPIWTVAAMWIVIALSLTLRRQPSPGPAPHQPPPHPQ